jgi:hypothetical protein
MPNFQRKLEAMDRNKSALELRLAGHSYSAIAEELGFAGASGAIAAVKRAMRDAYLEPALELRDMEGRRLDELLLEMWPKKNKITYLDRILKIMERRAKLFGLDAPAKIAPTSPDGQTEYTADGALFSPEERLRRIAALEKMVAEAKTAAQPEEDQGAESDI